MKRIAIACGLAGLLGLSGCAEQEEALIVRGAVAWPEDAVDEGCFVDPANEVLLSYGVLDLSCGMPDSDCGLASRYFIPVVLQSQLPPRDPGTSNAGIDTNEMQLREVEVSYAMPQAPDVINSMRDANPAFVHFNAPLATDSLPPGVQKGVVVEAVSTTQAEALASAIAQDTEAQSAAELTLLVTLIFYAERTGNTAGSVGEVESRDFTFPIKLCNGCLRSCQPCLEEFGGCPGTSIGWGGGVCGNAQDGPIVPIECLGN